MSKAGNCFFNAKSTISVISGRNTIHQTTCHLMSCKKYEFLKSVGERRAPVGRSRGCQRHTKVQYSWKLDPGHISIYCILLRCTNIYSLNGNPPKVWVNGQFLLAGVGVGRDIPKYSGKLGPKYLSHYCIYREQIDLPSMEIEVDK